MLRVGLTGGIGSGKSTVARLLVQAGARLVDADALSREVLVQGGEGLGEVAAAFGPDVLTSDGDLDRAALARRVFGDDAARAVLNGIVHPRVRALTERAFASAPAGSVVVNDVPLLAETGLAATYHLVLVVEAPPEVRLRRLAESRGMDPADARARMAAQADDATRRAVADAVLDNAAGEAELRGAVTSLWRQRLAPFAANVRAGRPAARPEHVELVPAQAGWEAAGARLAARIARAVGGARVDHIGSTAVPGLDAKDVIDLQLTAPSLDQANAWGSALDAAGFPGTGLREDTPQPAITALMRGAGAAGVDLPWAKRMHLTADPGRPAHLHVRVEGSPGWTTALLLRDWLRAQPQARAEYARLKREVAAAHPLREDYTSAKEPWFADACARAADWARATSWSPAG